VLSATAPAGVGTTNAVVRVQVRDVANNVGTATSGQFSIGTPPSIINPKLNKKFRTQAVGSNINPGALLVSGAEQWPLSLSGGNWIVGKQTRSNLNRRLKDVFSPGQSATITVRNSNGLSSPQVIIVVQN
jgi:hypothetical protein